MSNGTTKWHDRCVDPTGAHYVLSYSNNVNLVCTTVGRQANRANLNVANAVHVTEGKLQRDVLVFNSTVETVRVVVVQVLASACSELGVASIKQICQGIEVCDCVWGSLC